MEYKIKGEYIELMALLKIAGIADSGGQAGMMITEGYIKRNGETEFRKRAKLKPGDIIEFENKRIEITWLSQNIILKPTQETEVNFLFPIFCDDETVRYTNFIKFGDINLLKEFLERFLKINFHQPFQFGPYSIYLDNTIIGLCGAQQKNIEEGSTELWYILHKNYWGKGWAKKAATLVINNCRSNKQLKFIYAEAVNSNTGSWKILESLGFIKTGELKDGFIKGDISADLRYYLFPL